MQILLIVASVIGVLFGGACAAAAAIMLFQDWPSNGYGWGKLVWPAAILVASLDVAFVCGFFAWSAATLNH